MKSGNRYSRQQTTRVSTRPSSAASAWTGVATDHERSCTVGVRQDLPLFLRHGQEVFQSCISMADSMPAMPTWVT
eukprot:s474_g20.t1